MRICSTLLISLGLIFTTSSVSAEYTNGQAADLVLGQPDFVSSNDVCGLSGMNAPFGIAVNPISGKLYVSDGGNNRLLVYPATGLTSGMDALGVLGQADFNTCTFGLSQSKYDSNSGISFDADGNLWIGEFDNHRALLMRDADSKSNLALADLVIGQPDFTSSGSSTSQTSFDIVEGVHLDQITGRLWIPDYNSARILWWDNAADRSNGDPADGVLGQTDFTSGISGTTAATLNAPTGACTDPDGHVWVADFSNGRVLRFDNSSTLTNGAAANGVLGVSDFTTAGGGAPSQATIGGPERLVVDSQGTLWVVDLTHHRVLGFYDAANKANGAPADVVLGQPNFTSTGCTTTDTGLCTPTDLALDFQDQLLVVDTGNSRVVRYAHPAAQPDAIVTRKAKSKGSGVINSTGDGQTLRVAIPVGKKRTKIKFSITNISTTKDADAYVVQGSEYDKNRFRVKYFYNDEDVTDQVVAGTLMLKHFAPGAVAEIEARVSVKNGTISFKKTITLNVHSTLDQSLVDTVQAKVRRQVS